MMHLLGLTTVLTGEELPYHLFSDTGSRALKLAVCGMLWNEISQTLYITSLFTCDNQINIEIKSSLLLAYIVFERTNSRHNIHSIETK